MDADNNLIDNAWIVEIGEKARLDSYVLNIALDSTNLGGIQAGDAMLLTEERDGKFSVIGIGRVFRKRYSAEDTSFYFDGYLPASPTATLDELTIPTPKKKAPISRLDWMLFETVLKTTTAASWTAFPVITGDTPHEQAYVRELMQTAVMDDLLGPANGPGEEIIGMSVRDRYLVGKLAPMSHTTTEGIEGLQGQMAAGEDDFEPASTDEFEPHTGRHQPGEEFPSIEGASDTNPDEIHESNASRNQSLVPSSLGLTFCVDENVDKIQIEARWGRYERGESEQINEKTGRPFRAWKRIPSGGIQDISLRNRVIEPIIVDDECSEVIIKGSVSAPLDNGDRLVTLFLVNTQSMPDQNQDQAWVFQPELIVRDQENQPIFRRRPILNPDNSDAERESLEMIYRKHVEFAVGHGISVHSKAAPDDNERAVEIRTVVLPQNEVPITETPGIAAEDRVAMRGLVEEGLLDMEHLAAVERDDLIKILNILIEDYSAWIAEQRSRIGTDIIGYDITAEDALDRCKQIWERLKEGVSVLKKDDRALAAFRFANKAMASQRIRSIYALQKRRGEKPDIDSLDIPQNRSWRPFQLAFILLSIPALAEPTHKDRTASLEAFADLLWFPTGGGKTEAYLGVAAFTMAIRRLHDTMGDLDASRGLAVIMRYTLRLLTIQQFQRATTLICAMEVLRRQDSDKWGSAPFTIGLWVGQRVTPNTTEEAHEAIQAVRDGQRQETGSPAQLTFCPWCGSEILEGRDIEVLRFKPNIGKTIVYCGDKFSRCEFSKRHAKNFGLPVVVVDEEIYRRPPSMLIATVDKFALMAWRGPARTLFGKATQECPRHGLLWPDADCTGNHNRRGDLERTTVRNIRPLRPPDLIIQDEFHLISGPLGTMVGLYETAVDELSAWKFGDKTVRPKIIASTATVRKAGEQVNNVFLRQVSVFPPHGLDVEDNFFSVQRSIVSQPGRRYMGICAPGSSRPAVLIRVYVALLTAAQTLFERFGQAADPYMTTVGYFNSLRELGGMRRLAEDDVQTRAYRVQMSNVARPGLSQRSVRIVDELTSRVSNREIPKKLDQLEIKFKKTWERDETKAIDIVLATNMLSVGVDIDRLGLIAVNGQPKNTAEYIQATSRIGRVFPGLVCTVLTWSRPRDLSHYETFEHYHATFYKHVEAQSVTPFAPRALDRGLTGMMVSLMRLGNNDLNPNVGAGNMKSSTRPEVIQVRQSVSDRAWKVKDKKVKQKAETMVADRIDRWAKEAGKPGRRLGYQTVRNQGDIAALLKKPGALAWDEWTVPMSMREVEPGVKLIMDISTLPDPPEWRIAAADEKDGGES
jgi:hypothetical protein